MCKPQELSYNLGSLPSSRQTSRPIDTYPPSRQTSQSIDPLQSSSGSESARFMSMLSSQGSSLATTATMGLSPTPPTPVSPLLAAADHENFHSSVGVARQPLGIDDRGVVTDTERVETGHDRMQNGSVEGYNVGLFRSRSNHIAGSYPSDLTKSSGSSNTHEQLHYDSIGDTPGPPGAVEGGGLHAGSSLGGSQGQHNNMEQVRILRFVHEGT